jgi:hypothetical protein
MNKQAYVGKVRVLERLKSLIPPLTSDQLNILEQSLVKEGRAYNALWLWGDVLVDGHHRLEICKRNGIPYQVQQVYETADTIDEVEFRMKRDAIGQRNLPFALQSRFRAEMVDYHVKNGKGKQEAIEIVAKESSVSERQVYRDIERADLIEEVDEEVRPATDAMSSPTLRKLAELPKEDQKEVVKAAGGDAKKVSGEVRKKEAEKLTPEEGAKRLKSIAHQHRDKLVVAIDDYSQHKPNRKEQDRLVKLVQSVSLW